MTRGTWQTTDDSRGTLGLAAVIGAAVLIGSGAFATAVAALTDLLEIVLACTVAAVLIVAVAAVLIWRRYGHRPAPVREQVAAYREARQVRAVQQSAIAAPAPQVHFHFHGTAQPDAVLRAIRDGDRDER